MSQLVGPTARLANSLERAMNPSAKPNAFKDQERAGWNKKAADYDSHAGTVTRQAIEPLLDAVGAERGSELLDIASGPGYGAGAAAARGAQATGIDLSAAMVEEARRRFPDARFREGDAEALPFDDARFDAAICGFGLLHMPAPERAIAEAHRILRPGGRFGFTVWCPPAKAKFFEIVLAAIEAHVDTEVSLWRASHRPGGVAERWFRRCGSRRVPGGGAVGRGRIREKKRGAVVDAARPANRGGAPTHL